MESDKTTPLEDSMSGEDGASMFDDDIDWFEGACPMCGKWEVRRAECSNFDCEDGYYHDCGEDTCCCADPEPDTRCDECGGHGCHVWCSHCGFDLLRKRFPNGMSEKYVLSFARIEGTA